MIPRGGWGSCAWAAAWVLGCAVPAPVDRVVATDRVAPLQAQVAALRAHPFAEPVGARVVSQERANALIAGEIARLGGDELLGQEALAQALGLLPRDVALVPALLSLYQESVAGFYSGTSGHLYLVEGAEEEGLGEDALLVHELTHAYQDRHSEILTVMLGLRADDDLAFALGSLLEGDALWTEFAFEAEQSDAAMPGPDLVAHMFDVDSATPPGTPRLLQAVFVSPYASGYRLVVEHLARAGEAALDAGLRDPPLSSEEVLHPERYLEGEARRAVPDFPEAAASWPPAGCFQLASNAWGELGLRVFGLEAGRREALVERAADGWDGDRSWLLECAEGPAWAWLVQLDSARDATELEGLFRVAAEDMAEGAGVEREGLRVLLSSGLGARSRAYLLRGLPVRRHEDLASWLAAHPDVLRRARALRASGP